MLGYTPGHNQVCQCDDHLCRSNTASDSDRQTLPRVLVDHRQYPHCSPVSSSVHHEVVGAPPTRGYASLASVWMHDPSLSHSLPLPGCLLGTFRPSRRQILSTLLWLTLHPRFQGRAVILRYPYLPNPLASSTMSSVSDRSSSDGGSSHRWVDRGCSITLQARRSETPRTSMARTTH